VEWRSSRKCEFADEGVWGSDGEVSLKSEGADEGEVSCSCSPLSVLVVIELRVDEAKDEAEEGLWV